VQEDKGVKHVKPEPRGNQAVKPIGLTHKQKNLIWIWIFLLPSIAAFLAFYLMPIITLIATGFTRWDGSRPPTYNGINNYVSLFNSVAFKKSIQNLLVWTLVAATVHVAYSVLIAVYLYKKPFGGRFVRVIYMVPNIIAPAAWAMIYRYFYNQDIGIVNHVVRIFSPGYSVPWLYVSPHAMVAVTMTWVFYGVVGTLIVLGDLMAIPAELHEAARIDGASDWKITRMINLPLCRISIGTNILLSINARITMYEMIRFTTRGGPINDTWNLPLILTDAINNSNYGYANAVGSIMFAFGLIVLIIINRALRMHESVY